MLNQCLGHSGPVDNIVRGIVRNIPKGIFWIFEPLGNTTVSPSVGTTLMGPATTEAGTSVTNDGGLSTDVEGPMVPQDDASSCSAILTLLL